MDKERKSAHKKDKFALSEEEGQFARNLINEYAKQIKATVYSTLGKENRYLAEDTISEVCLLICEKIDTLKDHTCPKAWILVAARHTAQNIKRKHRMDAFEVSLDEAALHPTDGDVLEEALFNIWMEEKVPEKIIAKLTPREKDIYRKIYIENKTTKEIAEEFNISTGSVRNIHKNLKDKITDYIKRKDF